MWADVDATTRAANLHVPHRQQLVVVMATAAAAVGAAMLGRIRAVSPAASHHHARSFCASDASTWHGCHECERNWGRCA